VTRFRGAQRNLLSSSVAIRAVARELQTGEESIDSEAGWLLIADAMACLRTVRDFLTKK
jgi:hypothetical protein